MISCGLMCYFLIHLLFESRLFSLAVMELFIFTAFLLLMEVQSYKSPAVKVSPEVISESRSVKMICETPAGVTVKQCNFYRNSEQKNIKPSPSCELDLTGAEVLIWAAVKSPASVDINCFYTIHEDGIDKPSSHSPAATVTVLGSLQKPFISYNGDDVHPVISCEIPLSVRADFTCSLYTEDVLLYTRVSQTQRRQSGDHYCMFYLSHSELLTRSVNSLSCDYSLNTEPEIRSPRSDTITVRGLPQAKLTASASVIKETDTVQLSCENTEDLKMEMCYFNIYGRESNSKLSSSCQLSLTGSEISIWSEGQSSSVRITCFYTVKKSQVLVPSPHSDPVTVTVQISTTDTHVKTAKKTSLPSMSTSETHSTDLHSRSNWPTSTSEETTFSTAATTAHVTAMTTYSLSKSNPPTSTTKENTFSMATSTLPINRRMSDLSTWKPISAVTSTQKTSQRDTKISTTAAVSTTQTPASTGNDTWFIALVSCGVGVILTAPICLCCFACKKRRRKNNKMTSDVPSQEIGMSSGPAETYSLITSVPVTSQPISVGLEHPDSHQDNTPDPTATSSFIMFENSIYQPSGVLVNKQQKEGNTKENENVYHLYCTIPDRPVHSNAADQIYSLVKMH
ncbi:mucin-5AC-like isoform X2 [Megalobrama amblycephala]|uniref:mucin-5AC-like isoform X2 n=1 Tax=Megalobrama amblycephala TaxID=75352 RepID=UPI0020146A6B|nr:mucin-5AC-like isoform X2 [Megalobrama amblycephala]